MARHTFIIEVEIPDRYGDPAEHYEDIEECLMYEEIKGDMGDYQIRSADAMKNLSALKVTALKAGQM